MPPLAGQRRFVSDLDRFAKLFSACEAAAKQHAGANIGVAPHSLRAATPEEIPIIASMGDGPIHIHVAEQEKEVEAACRVLGKRPVEWLLENFDVGSKWCFIHATHMTPVEVEALAKSGATVGLCPITEANLGDGIFNGQLYLRSGGAFGIGTDSNVLISLAGELRQFEYSQRLKDRRRNVISLHAMSTGRVLFEKAVSGGARALGEPVAGITPGAQADIVSLRLDGHGMEGTRGDRILDGWIFAARDRIVDCVWVRGVKQVEGGHHRLSEEVSARSRATIRQLLVG